MGSVSVLLCMLVYQRFSRVALIGACIPALPVALRAGKA